MSSSTMSSPGIAIPQGARNRIQRLLAPRECNPLVFLAEVRLHFGFDTSDQEQVNLVMTCELTKFVGAILELHHEPGRHPDNFVKTVPVQAITAKLLRARGPYRWTTPGLRTDNNQDGAVIFEWDQTPHLIWSRPGIELPADFKVSAL